MRPLPWSPSALETFGNCPEQFRHKYILKDIVEEKSAEQIYGERVHEAFADRQRPIHKKLPPDLKAHEPFMKELAVGQVSWIFIEHKAALAKNLAPCEWGDKNVWCRMIIDYLRVDGRERHATIVDYKTGRPHKKFRQLIIYALWTFQEFGYVDTVEVMFYWTKDHTTTSKTWSRADIPGLWNELVSDLRQYKEAFRSDTWQLRQSGLCRGWCPVIGCKFWRPKS